MEKSTEKFARVYRFHVHQGSIESGELKLEEVADGSLLKITSHAIASGCAELADGTPLYFRLRIMLPEKCDSFVRTITPTDRWFQSGFEEVEYVDFRLNEARTLPGKIDELVSAAGVRKSTTFSKVSFLTAIPVSATLSESSAKLHKTRLLEQQIWALYVPNLPQGMMVYHWSKTVEDGKSPIRDFSAFVKLQTRRSSRKTIRNYLIIAFMFGVLGNLAASALVWIGNKAVSYSQKLSIAIPIENSAGRKPGAKDQGTKNIKAQNDRQKVQGSGVGQQQSPQVPVGPGQTR